MQLSVVLPTKNGAATIRGQLDALARQAWSGAWELVVADNGSTDGTLELVESYRGRLPELRTVDASAVIGPAHACNVGAREARGAVLAFVNDDDEVGEGWLEAMALALERHPFVAGRLEHDRLNQGWALAVRGRPQSTGLIAWNYAEYFPFAFGCTLGVRRELHEQVGGFDEEFRAGEDVDYCWRLQELGVELRFVPEAVTHYRFRAGLGATFRQARAYGRSDVLVYKKHRSRGLPAIRSPYTRWLRSWARLGRTALDAHSRTGLGVFLWHLGWRLGTAEAGLRERVVFP